MRITTERLTLEPISLKHLESTYAYSSDPDNTRYMFYLPHDSIGETETFITNAMEEWKKGHPSAYEFAVLKDETQIGGASMYMQGDGSAELAWILDRRWQGHGYAAEAARALIQWGRGLGLRRFIAQCDSENAPSWRLMERLGMRRYSLCGGRKNRSSDEERMELTYELFV